MEIANASSPFRYLCLFVIMLLAQVLICNNMLLFGVAVPFIFIYFIISLPLNMSLNILMSLSFALGILVDLFSDTLGLNSLACLILSVIKKPAFYAYMPKEDKYKTALPSISVMGWQDYSKFVLSLSVIFSILVFGIELFSFASFGRIIVMIASSAVFTFILMLAVDSIFNRS